MPIPKKPTKNADEFIVQAKAEVIEKNHMEAKKPKKLLVELDYDIWLNLKMMALKENKTLKDLITEILKKEVSNNK